MKGAYLGLRASRALPDIVGKVYGNLTVLRFIGRDRHGNNLWLCRCAYGNEASRKFASLNSKRGLTCGCSKDGTWSRTKAQGVSGMNKVHRNYQRNAQKRGHSWEITPEQFFRVLEKPCVYCGSDRQTRSQTGWGEYRYTGIDRWMNGIGYRADNIVPCCPTCNYAKRTLDGPAFLQHVSVMYHHTRNGSVSNLIARLSPRGPPVPQDVTETQTTEGPTLLAS